MSNAETKLAPYRVACEIAGKILRIETLVAENRDRCDFHELHVDQIREALEAAYAAGRASK